MGPQNKSKSLDGWSRLWLAWLWSGERPCTGPGRPGTGTGMQSGRGEGAVVRGRTLTPQEPMNEYKFCGEVLPPLRTFNSVLSVAFVSDATVSRSGFSARYWVIEGWASEGLPVETQGEDEALPDVPDEFYNYCKDLDFDSVAIPNFYGHENVSEILASRQWQEMTTVDRSCHPQIQLFLCSLLMPLYTTRKELPCQSWCREVKSSCPSDGSLFEAIDCRILPITECVNLEPPEDCYYGNGENYRGNGTLPEGSGKTCLSWTNVLELFGESRSEWDWVNGDPRENYCRNVGLDFYPSQEPYCIAETVFDGEEYESLTPCNLKPCDVPGCEWTPYVQYGRISPVQNFYEVGKEVFISCNVGYVIEDGDMSITCEEDGTWSKYDLQCTVDYRQKLVSTKLAKERYFPKLPPSTTVEVFFEAAVVEIIDADEKNENMFASIAFRLQWKDNRLTWDPTLYGEERRLVVTTKDVWIPKVFLQRNADARFSDFPEAPVTVTNDGLVEWDIIDLLTTTCDLKSALFPFDTMECPVCLGAITRVESFHCAENGTSTERNTHVEDFKACGDPESVGEADQWNARWMVTVNESEFGSGCINMTFHRIPTFHFCTTLFPIIILSLLMCITFVLPIEKGDRISFGITILLSMVVSLVFVTDVLPAKGSMPAVALLIVVYMCMMGFFLIVTVIVIRISSKDKDLPPFVKKVFLRYVARLVLLGDMTKPTQGHTVLKVDDFEMAPTSMPGNDSKSSEAEPDHLLEVLLSLKESVDNLSNAVETFGTSKPSEATEGEPAKTDYSQLARVLDRLCLILYVCGLILSIPIVRFSVDNN
ncbi:acetylcholine receptor subunit beta-like [Branchiostoma floridae x Branchiostoma japonicum]